MLFLFIHFEYKLACQVESEERREFSKGTAGWQPCVYLEQDNEPLPPAVVALNPLMNHNAQSDVTKLINRQTLDAGFRDFTGSGHVEWMKGQTSSPVQIQCAVTGRWCALYSSYWLFLTENLMLWFWRRSMRLVL